MQYTVNNEGFLNDVDAFVDACTETYKTYLGELLRAKRVEELSLNEMAFIRLVSSSSIMSMAKNATRLEILNKPVAKPAVQKSKPLTKDAVAAFLSKLSPEERAKLLGL